MNVSRFKVRVPDEVLADLRERLRRTRWPDELQGAGWDYGVPLMYVKELIEYWHEDFDWQKQEEHINSFANFRAEVDGLSIHFVHERGKGSDPLPLIITHGWPSSFYEMVKLVPLLTDPESYGGDPADSFDVVVRYRGTASPRDRGGRGSRIAAWPSCG
jgi:hypothetical protein